MKNENLDTPQNPSLQQTAVSRWVSVKDELPKEDGTFLTFTKNKVSESIGFTLFVDGQFMSSFVTHWAVVEKPIMSCDKPCSPSDWYKGGKCDKNGCYYE